MLELFGKRADMFELIDSNPNEVEARIRTKPSKAVFFHLLQRTKVSRILITRGIFATVPKKVSDALESSSVRIEIIEKKAGRPAEFETEKKLLALGMLREGKSAKKISQALGVPTTSIYAWKRRSGKKSSEVPDST